MNEPPAALTPEAFSAIASALNVPSLALSNVDVQTTLGWESTVDTAQALRTNDGATVAYLAPRLGRWRAVRWPAPPVPASELPSPTPDTMGPEQVYGRSVQARAREERQKPQPAVFLGVLEDALVFAGPQALPEAAATLLHLRRGTPTRVATPPDLAADLSGAPRRYEDGVVEWGPFPYAVPREAKDRLFELVPEATTLILRAIDAAAEGPHETVIEHR